MPTNYSTRTTVNTNYTARQGISGEVMTIITTGFWDDAQIWEDSKYWVDTGGTTFGTLYSIRTLI